jgi:hypothetical protein
VPAYIPCVCFIVHFMTTMESDTFRTSVYVYHTKDTFQRVFCTIFCTTIKCSIVIDDLVLFFCIYVYGGKN